MPYAPAHPSRGRLRNRIPGQPLHILLLMLYISYERKSPAMAYDARQIANWFIARAAKDGRVMSIMWLLKLVYIAHGWRLETQDAPLFRNRIEAWRYGPVIPDIYNVFRKQGIKVSRPAKGEGWTDILPRDENLLEQVYEIYGKLSALRLSNLTHVAGGPWDIAMKTGGAYAPIPDELIKLHYVMKRAKAEERRANV